MKKTEDTVFEQFLTDNGLKFTPERKDILDQVFRMHGHFEADEVAIGLRQRNIRVSRASIYRTIPMLVECGLLRKVYSSEKHSHFEHVFGHKHHDHLICAKCGKEIEFSNQLIEKLQDSICQEHNFKPTSHMLEISGLCAECQQEKSESKSDSGGSNDTQ